MKTVQCYQCEVCNSIHLDAKLISKCKMCGNEICDCCSGYMEDLCWNCNDKEDERLDKLGL